MNKVVVGMSGGVDSSVAAYLLKEKGYEVIGVTMTVRDGEDADAEKVAAELGIPFYTIDYRERFRNEVEEYFAEEYMKGRTPNPCIICNCKIKWEALIEAADRYGADMVATGHYARIDKIIASDGNERFAIRQIDADKKDQTYALYNLSQDQLARTMLPIGELSKEEVRETAKRIGLSVSDKPDSQEICFIPDHDYVKFICSYKNIKERPGNFISESGEILGEHKGIMHYTVGQRKGLGIAFGTPKYVLGIRPETNEVVLGDNKDSYSSRLRADSVNYMGTTAFDKDKKYIAKIRYSHKGETCSIITADDGIEVIFDMPVRAITPGQAVVIYDNDGRIMGGGLIK